MRGLRILVAMTGLAGCSVYGASESPSENGASLGPAGCPDCVTLADNQDGPTELVLVGETLHWITAGNNESAALRTDIRGGPIEKTEGDFGPGMHDLVFVPGDPAPGSLWVVTGEQIERIFTSSTCFRGPDGVRRLSALGDAFVWIGGDGLSSGRCDGDPANTLLTQRPDLLAVAGDDTRAWFTDSDGSISGCDADPAKCSSTVAKLATEQGLVELVAVDATRVYWATPGPSSSIRARDKSLAGTDGAPIEIASDQGTPKAIVPRGSDLYWTDSDHGTVMKAPAAGGASPTTLASGLDHPCGLAVTPTDIYVVESGAGRIVRIPRH
jgi:hypothetical protein